MPDLLRRHLLWTGALAPLALGIYHGTAEVNGDIDLSQADLHLALALAWRDIVLPGEAGAPSVRTRGQAHATGPLEAYALTLDGVFARGEEQARVTLQGQIVGAAIRLTGIQVVGFVTHRSPQKTGLCPSTAAAVCASLVMPSAI